MKDCVSVQDITEQQRKELLTKGDLYYYNNRSKTVRINNDVVGFYTTHVFFDKLTLEYTLFEKYRSQGLGYAFLNVITELVSSEYSNHDYIYLFIRFDNVASFTIALQNGYIKSYDEDLQQMVSEEMPNYLVYYKKNQFYKNMVKNK